MKKIPSRLVPGAALAVVLIIVAAQLPASGQGRKARRIEGTWLVTVTPRNCNSGAELTAFPGKNTFLAGGDMLATGSTTIPFLLSTGHGVWEHTGGRSFLNTVEFFAYNQDHTFVGVQRVTRNIELSESGDEYTSTDTFELPMPNGQVIRGCSTTVGRRME